MTIDEIKCELEKKLNPKRYIHSEAVADTAVKLARIYGADEKKAYLAGILHDCAKCYTDGEMFCLMDKYGIEPDGICRISTGLLHGFVGAEEARRIYGVDDDEIYDAIYYHTIGKPKMPLLTKIIYLADGIEPNRIYEEAEQIRSEAVKNINKAVVMYTDSTVEYVLKRGLLLHPAAVQTRNYYLLNY